MRRRSLVRSKTLFRSKSERLFCDTNVAFLERGRDPSTTESSAR